MGIQTTPPGVSFRFDNYQTCKANVKRAGAIVSGPRPAPTGRQTNVNKK